MAALGVQGVSKSAIARVNRIPWNTVDHWLEKAATCCRRLSDVNICGLDVQELQADEIRRIADGEDHVQKLIRNASATRSSPCDSRERSITIAGMNSLHPWQFLLITIAGWINRHRQDVIDYLVEENKVLKGQLRHRRLRLTDDQRRRLAVKGKALGRSVLEAVATIVTPETIMRWYRQLVSRKWDYSSRRRRLGRPPIRTEVARLVLGIARGNPRWGYTRIKGALAHLGHEVSRGTIANILRENGIEPAYERRKRTPWRTFLKAHWDTIAAADFFTIELVRPWGLVTYYVLFFMELSSRHVHVAGITPNPDGRFMLQVARNLTDPFDGFLLQKRYLILGPRRKVHGGVSDVSD